MTISTRADCGSFRAASVITSYSIHYTKLYDYLGYRLGHPAAEGGNGLAIPDSWKQELLSQREEIEGLRLGSEARTEVLALRLAQLQAQMVRLDALGERLTEQAGLDEGEFDFSVPPPQGGPEVAVDLAPARISYNFV